MVRHFLVGCLCWLAVAAAKGAAPATPQLLHQAIQNWLGERDHWAFTQRAVEYEDGIAHERLERYDPSRPGDQRWQLLAVDGKAPNQVQWQRWADRKFKHHHRTIDTPIGDFFDFNAAHVVAETPTLVRFEVPIRSDKNWLFPVDKVSVRVTINKDTKALEHLTAHVREPFKVLLGLARITGGSLDLDFLHFDENDPESAASQPQGTARVSVSKMGERVDFTWSDFKRVTPYRGAAKDNDPSAPDIDAVTRTP